MEREYPNVSPLEWYKRQKMLQNNFSFRWVVDFGGH